MKTRELLLLKLLILAVAMGVLVGASALPLVFSDSVVASVLRVLELVARLS